MATMQCDICGESLTMDVSGEYAVCDFCGLKHPRERLMKKVNVISDDVVDSATEKVVEETPIEETPIEEPEVKVDKPVENEFTQSEPDPLDTWAEETATTEKSTFSGEPVIKDMEEDDISVIDTSIEADITSVPVAPPTIVGDPEEIFDGSSIEMTDEMEAEKKNKKIQDLKLELKEFEDIFEANKGKLFGEGLKRKNYSQMKINEITEKLKELED